MRILIAPDSMKDCLPAEEVARNIELGIRKVLPDADIKIIPMADGGEGTTETLVTATGGKLIEVSAHDPFMREIKACYGILGDGKTAVVEVAAASGLELLKKAERNPWLTTSYGSGELLRSALDHGCGKILLGLGGSATNDAGAGIIQALGGKFLDKNRKEIRRGGGALSELAEIDLSELDQRLSDCLMVVACDVKIPLCGEQGTSKIYGDQKGADNAMREKLDDNLRKFAGLIKEKFKIDITDMEGAGAAGGIGGGLKALLHAELKPGFNMVAELTKLESAIKESDLIITGEGRTDAQTLSGKVPFGIAQLGKKYNIPVMIISGSLLPGSEKLYDEGVTKMIAIKEDNMPLEEAISNAPQLLQRAAAYMIRDYMKKTID
ncbi:MAG TPA: glycerate kinase [Cytophagaceae bacterium]|jgi:glycerate kinase|nr:glycerate kinase [Cytophagaceae bacterium]